MLRWFGKLGQDACQGNELLGIEGKKIIQKNLESWHSMLPITQHFNVLFTLQSMNYLTKQVKHL